MKVNRKLLFVCQWKCCNDVHNWTQSVFFYSSFVLMQRRIHNILSHKSAQINLDIFKTNWEEFKVKNEFVAKYITSQLALFNLKILWNCILCCARRRQCRHPTKTNILLWQSAVALHRFTRLFYSVNVRCDDFITIFCAFLSVSQLFIIVLLLAC